MNRRIIVAVDDLFFAAKIRGTAEQFGMRTDLLKTADAVFEASAKGDTALIIVDLHAKFCDPFELAARLKGDARRRGIPVVGFYSHVQTELKRRAGQAGVDCILPRSVFSQRLPEILRGITNNTHGEDIDASGEMRS